MDLVTIEIYSGGQWHKAANFTLYGKGYSAGYHTGGSLSYDIDYVLPRMEENRTVDRVGCLYHINFELHNSENWPAFLLDILPTGAAKEAWLKKLRVRDDETAW